MQFLDVKTALKIVNEANLTKDELEAQHKRKEFISIQKLAILKATNDGIEKGLKQGIEQGIEKGLEKAKLQTAKLSIKQGLDDKTISLITGLDKETIKKLKINT